MRRKILPGNVSNEKLPRPMEIRTGSSYLTKKVKQIMKRQKVDKIWFYPALCMKPLSFELDYLN